VETSSSWTFLSNHTHVLLCIAQEPDARLRDVALRVGITERAVQKIVGELEDAGALTRLREGRRNLYLIHPECPLRHPIEQHQTIGKLLALVLSPTQMRNLQRRNRALELATGS
jgi:predicted transcriptional regulator of viral defense system